MKVPSRRTKGLIACAAAGIAVLASVTGCRFSPATAPREAAGRIALELGFPEDPRTYSVGRVRLRALDAEGNLLAALVGPADRATGRFSISFEVPAGTERTIVVEPLGSAVLPDGGKTESGVALQGLSEPLDLAAAEVVEISVPLLPFIPDSLRIESDHPFDEPTLVWKPMRVATSHTIRVIGEAGERLVVGVEGHRIPLRNLQSDEERILGLQVRSENSLSVSAFSDTLFLR